MRPADVHLFVVQRPPNDGLFILYRGQLHLTRPVLHCHVCDSPLEHGDFCPLPPSGPTPFVACVNCYWDALEILGEIGAMLSKQQAAMWN